MRGWMMDRQSYIPPIQIGEVMRAACVGQGVESRHPDFNPGDLVRGIFGWQDYSGGRLELGLGTGYWRPDYAQSGIPLDPTGVRVRRFAEAVRGAAGWDVTRSGLPG